MNNKLEQKILDLKKEYQQDKYHNSDKNIDDIDKNVIIDFYASWCPPCKIMSESLEDFSKTKPKNVEIYKVNVDDESTLARKYNISKLPTILYFKNGKPVKEFVGVLSPEELTQTTKVYFK